MNEVLLFLVGSLVSVNVLLTLYVYRLYSQARSDAQKSGADLESTLKGISDVHNGLAEAFQALDKKVSETSLRVDMLAEKKSPTGLPFYSMGKL